MRSSVLFLLGLLLISNSVWARGGISARRESYQNWQDLSLEHRDSQPFPPFQSNVAMDRAKHYEQVDYSKVSTLDNLMALDSVFKKLRDHRYLADFQNQDQLRRSTWMYPDDGCYARAAMMNQHLEEWGEKPLTKVFVFGDLEVTSPNAAYGKVGWWYHVAPIVNVAGEKYVIDPSVDATRPLKLKEWLLRMVDVKYATVSVCTPWTYTPYSDCVNAALDDDDAAREEATYFLPFERNRIKLLGRDPVRELGDFPPWLDDEGSLIQVTAI